MLGPTSELKPKKLLWKTPLDEPQGSPLGAEVVPGSPCALQKECAVCRGEGYLLGTKGAFTAAHICRCVVQCPTCLGQARRIEGGVSRSCRTPSVLQVVNLINGAQVPARYADANLTRYQNYRDQGGNGRQVLGEVRGWLQSFEPGQGLIIEGPVGCGKTFILASLAKVFATQGYSVKFADFFQLLSEIKAGFSEGKSDAALIQPLIDVDILVIDELGKGRNTDFELTVIDQLVCGRYNQKKSILASTNYKLKSPVIKNLTGYSEGQMGGGSVFNLDSLQGLEERIGKRIFSRLKEMALFLELNEDDYRARGSASK